MEPAYARARDGQPLKLELIDGGCVASEVLNEPRRSSLVDMVSKSVAFVVGETERVMGRPKHLML